MANIAMKPPSDRDAAEKQFFVMYLKLRVPFFSDFDKKTLRMVMERMLCSLFDKQRIIEEFGKPLEQMHIILNGAIGQFPKMNKFKAKDATPHAVIEKN